MSEQSDPTTTSAKPKTAIQILRERRGGVPRELVERNRQQSVIRKRITTALRDEPKTVPELAREIDQPSHEVLWHVMGMKKYGKVVETEQVDGYFKYQLIDESRQTETTS
jgi:predicted Rossmann fold nucleotide-binding protein DprA/Smf involved in DNA uptake